MLRAARNASISFAPLVMGDWRRSRHDRQPGLRQPPSYHDARLINAPVGHFFDVMTNGYGAMYSYASRVPVDDRWRIAAYIRALQLSQNAPPELARQNPNAAAGGAAPSGATPGGQP